MKTIIATTDYSETANNAVAFAAALALYFKAKLILFNAIPVPNPTTRTPFSTPDIEEMIRLNKERLHNMAQEVAQVFEIETKYVSSVAFMIDGLKKLVHEEAAELVVMGMRGSSLTHKLFGSVTTSTLRQADFPVLVIPGNVAFHQIQKILFACDSRKLSLATNLNLIKKLVYAFNAHLQILQVVKEKAMAVAGGHTPAVMPNIELIFKGIQHSYQHIDNDDIVKGIEKGIQDYQPDLLVMAPHKAGFWDTMLRKSNTRAMSLRTRIPLLAIPGT